VTAMPRTPIAKVRTIKDVVLCPSCHAQMLIERRQPLLPYTGQLAVTYRCLMCSTETILSVKDDQPSRWQRLLNWLN
jgi:DNA-directed RNA polymerase subunit RPC12/RpoP